MTVHLQMTMGMSTPFRKCIYLFTQKSVVFDPKGSKNSNIFESGFFSLRKNHVWQEGSPVVTMDRI